MPCRGTAFSDLLVNWCAPGQAGRQAFEPGLYDVQRYRSGQGRIKTEAIRDTELGKTAVAVSSIDPYQ
jgi:hypothetical protein